MGSHYNTTSSPFGDYHDIILVGNDEESLRREFEQVMNCLFKPKLNKMQEYVYGSQVKGFTRGMLQKIVDTNGGTGKTTAHAMKQIAEAIQNPGKEIQLTRDEGDSPSSRRFYINDHVKPIIEKLGLKFLVIKEHNQTIKFDI